ncbi:MAG: peptidoglycan-binding protein [Patescibacteria group bacterium]
MLNKKIFRFVSVFFVFALMLVGFSANKAEASAISSTGGGGPWNTGATWVGGIVPVEGDAVTIVGGDNVTLASGSAGASSITINNTAGGGTLTVSGGTLTVSGNITFNGSSAVLTTSAGAINVGGNFGAGGTFDGTGSTLTFNGAGAQAMGTYTTYNNVIVGGSGTVSLSGTTTVGGTLAVNSGTLSAGANTLTATGALSVANGATLTMAGNTFTASNTTNVASGGTLTISGTGTKTFTGAVTDSGTMNVNAAATLVFSDDVTVGGTYSETAAATVGIAGSLANSGTFTASSGVHTLSGSTKTLTGTLSIPSLTVDGTYTNNGTLTVGTALAGSGTLTQGASTTLNLGGTSATFNLDATATGNNVNYTGGAQTVKFTNVASSGTYYNLSLSGSGVKTFGGALIITKLFNIDSSLSALPVVLVGASSSDTMKVYGGYKSAGVWGSTNVGASPTPDHTSDFYFAAAGTGTVDVARRPSSNNFVCDNGATDYPACTSICSNGATDYPTCTPPTPSGSTTSTVAQSETPVTITVTAATPTTPAVTETTMSPGCSGGNKYNTSTGDLCVNNEGVKAHGPFNLGTMTLKNGSKGDAVMELQKLLNQLLNLGLVVDGKLGPKTISVIKKWQKAHDLVADGLVGPKTKAKMKMEAGDNE